MKQFFFGLVIAGLTLFVCSCNHQVKPESVLFRDFSLGAIVEQMSVPQLQPKTGGNNMSTAIGATTERHRSFDLEYLIDETGGERFDEAGFLSDLKLVIAKKIGQDGAQTNGSDSTKDSFYFEYSKNENRGSIRITGEKVQGNKYKLSCILRETAGAE